MKHSHKRFSVTLDHASIPTELNLRERGDDSHRDDITCNANPSNSFSMMRNWFVSHAPTVYTDFRNGGSHWYSVVLVIEQVRVFCMHCSLPS